MGATTISFIALAGLKEFECGDDVGGLIAAALEPQRLVLQSDDVLVIAQKIVSKAEGRVVCLNKVTPSVQAQQLAEVTRKDARLIEVILSESQEVVRAAPNVLIVRHRLGFVMANAGVDRSNVPDAGKERVLLLPRDPHSSAHALRARLRELCSVSVGIIISDSFGRPWRRGVLNVALASAGVPALIDRRGERDRNGRALEMTEVAFADAVSAGAALAMGEAAEGTPVVLVRGLDLSAPECGADTLLRPEAEDLFR
jgi:coenzyme F420-0:L-glutamate ligase/coenzyme F420-1:gamma-L-glutamate ligase